MLNEYKPVATKLNIATTLMRWGVTGSLWYTPDSIDDYTTEEGLAIGILESIGSTSRPSCRAL